MKKAIAFGAGSLALIVAAACSAPAASTPSDEQVFERECAICHGKMGTGTLMLARRLGEENAILADRTDLDADYIEAVVRKGIGSMPAITRVEVTDDQLEQIKHHLTRNKEKAAQ